MEVLDEVGVALEDPAHLAVDVGDRLALALIVVQHVEEALVRPRLPLEARLDFVTYEIASLNSTGEPSRSPSRPIG